MHGALLFSCSSGLWFTAVCLCLMSSTYYVKCEVSGLPFQAYNDHQVVTMTQNHLPL